MSNTIPSDNTEEKTEMERMLESGGGATNLDDLKKHLADNAGALGEDYQGETKQVSEQPPEVQTEVQTQSESVAAQPVADIKPNPVATANYSSEPAVNVVEAKPEEQEAPPVNTEMKKDAPQAVTGQQNILNMAKKKHVGFDTSKVVVDLNNIDIVTGTLTELDKIASDRYIFENVPGYQVVACQSSYSVEATPLGNQEIDNILTSNEDLYKHQMKVYNILFDKLTNFSFGKPTFNDFMKMTSYFDVNTLFYGLLNATFPRGMNWDFQCTDSLCNHKFSLTINNKFLVDVKPESGVFDKINEVIHSLKTPKEVISNSLVNTTRRVMLNDSKIILDLYIPTIMDYMEKIMKKSKDKELREKFSSSLGISLLVKNMYKPYFPGYKEGGKLPYLPAETDSETIARTIAKISREDGIQLEKAIADFVEKFTVNYAIDGVKCPRCGKVFEKMELPDMEELFFHELRQRESRKENNNA